MPTKHHSSQTLVASLPGSALLRIFQLVCDSCAPDVPGTCWLAPVCKQWQGLAFQMKGLGVLFQGTSEQQVTSFCAWLRRYVRQVVALAITSEHDVAAAAVLQVLESTDGGSNSSSSSASKAAASAAAGGPLPLQRLVVTTGHAPYTGVRVHRLPRLWGALPLLRHLQMVVWVGQGTTSQGVGEGGGHALGPLPHSTALTSLVLGGQGYLVASLPPNLRSLDWELHAGYEDDPQTPVFDCLSALTHLKLSNIYGPIPADAFTALPQLRNLELQHVPVSDEGAAAHKGQLVSLGLVNDGDVDDPEQVTAWLDQLTNLRHLDLYSDLEGPEATEELLRLVPGGLQELRVELLPQELLPQEEPWCGDQLSRHETVLHLGSPWVLRHYKGLSALQRLGMGLDEPLAAPQGLSALTQLKQLEVIFSGYKPTSMAVPGSWALARMSWAEAVARLVNLEVLRVPGMLTACSPPWLTALTRLVVLEVCRISPSEVGVAAPHISQLLAPQQSSSSDAGSSSSLMQLPAEQVRMVCFSGYPVLSHLQRTVAAAQPGCACTAAWQTPVPRVLAAAAAMWSGAVARACSSTPAAAGLRAPSEPAHPGGC